MTLTQMKNYKALVHVHVFYKEMFEEIRDALQNITVEYDLFVTMIEEDVEFRKQILAFKKNSVIKIVENRGFDIGPFLSIINKIDLDNYDFIIKLHTKGNVAKNHPLVHHVNMSGNAWRKFLLSFLASKEVFDKQLALFESNGKIGMTADDKVTTCLDRDYNAKKILNEFLRKNQIKQCKYKFVAGSMFMARAQLFKQLQQCDLKIEDFAFVDVNRAGELAHAIERYLGQLVYSQGFVIKPYQNILQILFIDLIKFKNRVWNKLFRIIKNKSFREIKQVSGPIKIKYYFFPMREKYDVQNACELLQDQHPSLK
ncbi:rhamnan synthesis F family protein [Lentisphaerota bacterium WC36G]|nr:hypothetical protein LJT99_04730 [Lentisphaerae bacterium WC36]